MSICGIPSKKCKSDRIRVRVTVYFTCFWMEKDRCKLLQWTMQIKILYFFLLHFVESRRDFHIWLRCNLLWSCNLAFLFFGVCAFQFNECEWLIGSSIYRILEADFSFNSFIFLIKCEHMIWMIRKVTVQYWYSLKIGHGYCCN